VAADLTPRYSEQDLRRYDDLIAAISDRVALLQAFIDQLTSLDELQEAWSALDEMIETIALFEAERRRILEALTK
jgi:signal-transduction protein with cAMP-binding, CBS, and nucleotidyltransferase domain